MSFIVQFLSKQLPQVHTYEVIECPITAIRLFHYEQDSVALLIELVFKDNPIPMKSIVVVWISQYPFVK